MALPPLPPAFVERMTALLGDEADAFFASYDRPARPGLRVNPRKITPEEFHQRSPWPLDPVPWCPNGFYLPEDAPAGKHPWHAAGVYYLQEPSAMAPAEQLPISLQGWVADLCAAPGGKATQIDDKLTGRSLLVANELVGGRIKPLGENLERWGADETVITNLEVRRIAELLPAMFDTVLVDAPCSGEGLFRRSPEARAEWSPAHVEGSARRQRSLLEHAAKLVGAGGSLIYSTCTFAPEENEQVIDAFLEEHPSWRVEPIDGFAPGRSAWAAGSRDLSGVARLWPHELEGDGHTIARLRRPGEPDRAGAARSTPQPRLPSAAQRALDAFREQFVPGLALEQPPVLQGDAVYLPPSGADALGDLPLVRRGLWLGSVAPGRFVPSHALALALDPSEAALAEPLDFEEAARYLSGETLTRPGEPGWVLITFDGFPLGWGKRTGDVIKNHYPKGLRRPVSSWLSAVS